MQQQSQLQQQQLQQQQQQQLQQQQQQQSNMPDANTFRQPLPPGLISRPQRMNMPGAIIRQTVGGQQIVQKGARNIIMTSDLRQRFVRPPVGGVIASGQQVIAQQQTLIPQQQQQQQPFSPQQSQAVRLQTNIVNVVKSNNEMQSGQVIGQRLSHQGMQPIGGGMPQGSVDAVAQPADADTQEIPDNVTAELEKLEHENAVMSEVEGVGDLLGDLGEDDDDELLNSLTAEMGADFNILEYADPELDTLNDGDKANLLDSLDFGDAEPEKGSVKKEPSDPTNPNKPVEDCNQHVVTTQQQLQQQSSINVTGAASTMNVQQTLAGQMRQISNVTTSQIQSQVNQPQQLQQQANPQLQQQLNRLKLQMNSQQLPPKLQQIQQQMQLQVSQEIFFAFRFWFTFETIRCNKPQQVAMQCKLVHNYILRTVQLESSQPTIQFHSVIQDCTTEEGMRFVFFPSQDT